MTTLTFYFDHFPGQHPESVYASTRPPLAPPDGAIRYRLTVTIPDGCQPVVSQIVEPEVHNVD